MVLDDTEKYKLVLGGPLNFVMRSRKSYLYMARTTVRMAITLGFAPKARVGGVTKSDAGSDG